MFWKHATDKEHGRHSNHPCICKGRDSDVMLTKAVDEILIAGSIDTMLAEVSSTLRVRAIAEVYTWLDPFSACLQKIQLNQLQKRSRRNKHCYWRLVRALPFPESSGSGVGRPAGTSRYLQTSSPPNSQHKVQPRDKKRPHSPLRQPRLDQERLASSIVPQAVTSSATSRSGPSGGHQYLAFGTSPNYSRRAPGGLPRWCEPVLSICGLRGMMLCHGSNTNNFSRSLARRNFLHIHILFVRKSVCLYFCHLQQASL